MSETKSIFYISQKDSVPTLASVKNTGVEVQMVGTIQKADSSINIDLSNNEKSFCFHSNLKYWNEATMFMSSNNYDNSYFKAIVDMGEDAVPFIKEELQKKPSSLVHALDLIYPGRIKFNGYVSLKKACDVWLQVLSR